MNETGAQTFGDLFSFSDRLCGFFSKCGFFDFGRIKKKWKGSPFVFKNFRNKMTKGNKQQNPKNFRLRLRRIFFPSFLPYFLHFLYAFTFKLKKFACSANPIFLQLSPIFYGPVRLSPGRLSPGPVFCL